MTNSSGISLEDAGSTWELLTAGVEEFVNAWEAGLGPPRLGEFVPVAPNALRRLVLVELIKVDLEYRCRDGQDPRRVEDYLAEFPELHGGGVPCDLVYEEFHVRKRAGEHVTPDDYCARFPQQAGELGRLFGLAVSQSTALRGAGPWEELHAGDQVDDFDLLAPLGKGAFGCVFLARQRSLGRLVALKVSADRGSEPQTLAQLDHPHIVRVYDQRVLPELGLRLLYMPCIDGGTIQDAIARVRQVPVRERSGRTLLQAVDATMERRGQCPPAHSAERVRLAALSWPDVVCWLGLRLADALDHAARVGVLHRDVKPANVLLTAEGSPKLADFNVSFSTKFEGAGPAAFFGGSLPYMSPEHLEAFNPVHPRDPASVDGRSDLYSLAVTLWELLTGCRPFPDESLGPNWPDTLDKMAQRRSTGAEALRGQLEADCPAELARILLACLAADPQERIQTGQELRQQFALCLQPRAQLLLSPSLSGWRWAVGHFPTLFVLLAAVWPNLLGSFLNFIYNRSEIVGHLQNAETVFWYVLLAINGAAFSLGIALLALLIRPVAQGLKQLRTGRPLAAPRQRVLRQRCLNLGDRAAAISLSAWLLAGLAYPIAMGLAGVRLPLELWLHFMASLALCGLIAAVGPFFGATFLCVRFLYPALARAAAADAEDIKELFQLNRLMRRYVLLAAAMPMLAVITLVLINSQSRFGLGMLSAVGLMGFALAFWHYRMIQADLQALVNALRPPGESSSQNSDSSQSLWGG